jgi:hypothetical protein
MGLGPPILALYRQMKLLGAFEGVRNVMELGAQNVWCKSSALPNALFEAFDRPKPDAEMVKRFIEWKGSGRELYEQLGMTYKCVDLDPNFESVRMDLNFDSVPAEEVGKYCFVTNHGTSEHIANQLNVFKAMHEFCRPGGMLLHAVTFTVHLEHGFFNYQPNFFHALAKYNGYEMMGIWVGPDWQLSSLIPWELGLLDYLVINSKTTHLLVVLQRKLHDTPFCVPFQEIYEDMIPKDALSRYAIVVDGTLAGATPGKHLTDVPGKQLLQEVRRRIVRKLIRKFGGG